MNPTDARAVAIFQVARELSEPARREAVINAECGDDLALEASVRRLLQEADAKDSRVAALLSPEIEAELGRLKPEEAGEWIGPYKLREQVGEGGFGTVWVADQETPVKRRVALKIIKLGMDTKEVIARFGQERQALAMMDHPNIAKVLDAGATQFGRPFFVMELVRGIKITDYCDQAKLSTAERLNLFILVCHAVQHAHQKGIIHRDLKPSNILITLHDGVPVPKVIDFGIAKATEGRLTDATVYTQLHQFVGTPAYMSPEQAEMSGLDVDTRSDIYSLGVLLYELLAGSTPFDAEQLMAAGIDAMRKTIREEEPMRPSTRLATLQDGELTTTARQRSADAPKLIYLLKGDLDWIVMKCLEKDRTRRYESASDLGADLKRHLGNEPVVARPPSTAYRLQKAFRRNKLVFGAGAAVVLALIAGLSLAAIGWRQTRVERDNAVQARAGEEAQRKVAQANAATALEQKRRAEAEKAEADHLLYVANMNLSQQAWDQNNIGRLRQLLEETQNSPYRGFEWYYWQPQIHLALKTLRGHLHGIMSVASSPDGRRIVTGSLDQTAMVWDVATGQAQLTLKGHTNEVRSVGFSPDGQRILTGSIDGTAKVWDAATGLEVLTLKGRDFSLRSVAFSPDGRRIVAGGDDSVANVWDAATGLDLLTLEGHQGGVISVGFSLDGQRIVTASWDRTVKVWDSTTGRTLLTLAGHNRGINAVAFSPDGQRIVSGSWDNTAKIWDAVSGRELLTLKGHSHAILCVAFSPDSQRVATGSNDNTVKVWEAASGRELFTLKGHESGIYGVAFFPDGQRIVTGGDDGMAKVWQAASDLPADQTVRKPPLYEGHGASVTSLAISRDSQRIMIGSTDRTARVWEVSSGREILTLKGHTDQVMAVAISPDGQRAVTGSADDTAKVWDAITGKELITLDGHSGDISSVAFSPDGQRILTGSQFRTVKVWEAASGRELLALQGHVGWVKSADFSPDGARIVTGSDDKTAKVWDAATGRELLTLKGHEDRISSVAFSPDGERIVTGSYDHTAKVWNAANGHELVTLKGHSDWLRFVAFSPNGHRIVTGSDDASAKVWEVNSGRELLTLRGHTDGVAAVAFSWDGQQIVTGSDDGTVRIWEAARPAQVAVWQEQERKGAEDIAARRRERAAGPAR